VGVGAAALGLGGGARISFAGIESAPHVTFYIGCILKFDHLLLNRFAVDWADGKANIHQQEGRGDGLSASISGRAVCFSFLVDSKSNW